MSEHRDVIESLFKKSGSKPEGGGPRTAVLIPSLNATDQFPAPGTEDVEIWKDKSLDAYAGDHSDLYWNVFDVSGIITEHAGTLFSIIGTSIPVLGGSFKILAVSKPIVWRDPNRGWTPGPLTRFTMACAYEGSEISTYYESACWPGMLGKILIAPRVPSINTTGGATTYDKHRAGPSGAPFCLYKMGSHPLLSPHYLYSNFIRKGLVP